MSSGAGDLLDVRTLADLLLREIISTDPQSDTVAATGLSAHTSHVEKRVRAEMKRILKGDPTRMSALASTLDMPVEKLKKQLNDFDRSRQRA